MATIGGLDAQLGAIRANAGLGHGTGRIAGDSPGGVTVDGVPSRRVVYLFIGPEMHLIARTISDASGRFEFLGLAARADYTVVGRDQTGVNNAVIADRITPVIP